MDNVIKGGQSSQALYAAGALSLGHNNKLTDGLGGTALRFIKQAAAEDPKVQAQLEAFQALQAAAQAAPTDLGKKEVKKQDAAETAANTQSKVSRFSKKALKYALIAGALTVAVSAYIPNFCKAQVATDSEVDLGFCEATVGPATAFNTMLATATAPALAAGGEALAHLYDNAPDLTRRFVNWQSGRGFTLNP